MKPLKHALFIVLFLLSSTTFAATMNIEGVDRVKLIQALYQRAQVLGMGRLQFDRAELSEAEAKSLVGKGIDYLHGKVMKIMVPAEGQGNEVETWGYNRDNGDNAAEKVVEVIRASGNVKAAVETGPKQEDPEVVRLRNGSELPKALAMVGLSQLLPLIKSQDLQDHLALYELREKARNPNHKFFGTLGEKLRSLGLVDESGQVPSYVKDLVLSSAQGEGLDVRYVNPIAKTQVLTGNRCADLFR